MTAISSPRAPAVSHFPPARRMFCHGLRATLIAVAACVATAVACAAAAPDVGDTFAYRILNGYNNEAYKAASYRIQSREADRVVVEVAMKYYAAQSTGTEIYRPDGNWLRHTIVNHDQLVDYTFSPAYPSYQYPLEPGKEWSTRVNAVNALTGASHSVRIDATVVGTERIRVPAGEFDTIKIRRSVYAGDATSYMHLTETNIAETEWFAPALGRTVRIARNSGYLDLSRGPRNRGMPGDWEIHELVSAPPAR